MDRDNIYRKPLHELNLTELAQLCANVAINHSANSTQTDTAHALRVDWVRLCLDTSLDGARTQAEDSLKKRIVEFLSGLPAWMMTGI